MAVLAHRVRTRQDSPRVAMFQQYSLTRKCCLISNVPLLPAETSPYLEAVKAILYTKRMEIKTSEQMSLPITIEVKAAHETVKADSQVKGHESRISYHICAVFICLSALLLSSARHEPCPSLCRRRSEGINSKVLVTTHPASDECFPFADTIAEWRLSTMLKLSQKRADVKPKGKYPAAGLLQKFSQFRNDEPLHIHSAVCVFL